MPTRTSFNCRIASCILAVMAFLPLSAYFSRAADQVDGPTDAELEIFARNVGYAGGRQAAGESADNRNLSALSIKGDKTFRDDLAKQGLKFINAIDDPKTGLQATLVETEDGKPVLIFRGTEFHVGTEGERKRDIGADIDPRGIGYGQYEANQEKINEMISDYEKQGKKITVTGHSLGGALAQRFIADHPGQIDKAVLFNSPGIDTKTTESVARNQLPPITYYKVPDDPVSELGGTSHLGGTVYTVTGGKTDTGNVGSSIAAEHRGTMLQQDSNTTISEDNFERWQDKRKIEYVTETLKTSDRTQLVTTLINKGLGGDKLIQEVIDSADELSNKPRDAATAARDATDDNKIRLLDKIEAGEIILAPGVTNRQFIDAYQEYINNPTPATKEKFRSMRLQIIPAPAAGQDRDNNGQQVAPVADKDFKDDIDSLEKLLFGDDTAVSRAQEHGGAKNGTASDKTEPEPVIPAEKTGPVTDDEVLPDCNDVPVGTRCREAKSATGETDAPGQGCDKPCPDGQTRNCGRIKAVGGTWQYIDLGCVGGDNKQEPEELTEQDIEKEDWEVEWEENYQAYQDEQDRLAEEEKLQREKEWEEWKKFGYQGPDIDIQAGPEWRQLGWGEYLALNKELRISLANLYTFMMTKRRSVENLEKVKLDCSPMQAEIKAMPADAASWTFYYQKLTKDGYGFLRLQSSTTLGGGAALDGYWPELAGGQPKTYLDMLVSSARSMLDDFKGRVAKNNAELQRIKDNSKYLLAAVEYNSWFDRKANLIQVINENMPSILDRTMWTPTSSPEPITRISAEDDGACMLALQFVEELDGTEKKLNSLTAWLDQDEKRVEGLLAPVKKRLAEWDPDRQAFSGPTETGIFSQEESQKKLDNITLQLARVRDAVMSATYEGAVSGDSVQQVTSAFSDLRRLSPGRADRLARLAATAAADRKTGKTSGAGSSRQLQAIDIDTPRGQIAAVIRDDTAVRPWRLLQTVVIPENMEAYLGNDPNGSRLYSQDVSLPPEQPFFSGVPSPAPEATAAAMTEKILQPGAAPLPTGKTYVTSDPAGREGLTEIASGETIYFGQNLQGEKLAPASSGRLYIWNGVPGARPTPTTVIAGASAGAAIAFDPDAVRWLRDVLGSGLTLAGLDQQAFDRLLVQTINFEISYLDEEIMRSGLVVKNSKLVNKTTALRHRLDALKKMLASLRQAPSLEDLAFQRKPAYKAAFQGIKGEDRLELIDSFLVGWEQNALSHEKRYAIFKKIESLHANAAGLAAGGGSIADLDRIETDIMELVRENNFDHDNNYYPDLQKIINGLQQIRLQLHQGEITRMYADFAAAYSQRDTNSLVTFLASEWEASDGTDVDEMETVLQNSFDVFDEVTMQISNLRIRPTFEDFADHNFLFEAVYTTRLTGIIRDNDIRHDESASIQDSVIITPNGPKILKTGGGRLWLQ